MRALCLALLVFLIRAPSGARASENVQKSPRDVPLVVQPSAILVPPLPETDQVRDLGWLRVAYPPSAHVRVQPLLDDADEVKAQLADELGQAVLARPVEVRIARTPEDMAALAPREIPPPPYASAVALPGLRLVLLSMRSPLTDEGTNLGELLRHELAHIALDDAVAGTHVPLWFNEGFAVHASNEDPFARAKTLSDAAIWKTIVPLKDLDGSFPAHGAEVGVAYAESADFVRFLLRQADRARFAAAIDRTRKGEDFDRSLEDAYGTDLRRLEYEWREELAKRYTFWPVLLSGSAVWVLAVAALGVGMVRKKGRDKAVLARWEREEQEEGAEAARRIAVTAAAPSDGLPSVSAGLEGAMRSITPSVVPKIEHDGNWHTLH